MFWTDGPAPDYFAGGPPPADDDFWYDPHAGPWTQSGNRVTETTATRISAVWSCIKILSESIGQLPLHLHRRDGDSKERVTDHPAAELMRRPNGWMTRMEFVEFGQFHLGVCGSGFAEILPGRGRSLIRGALLPHQPQNVRVTQRRPSLRLEYQVTDPTTGHTRTLPQEQMLHLRGGMLRDGVTSLSPVGELRETMGAAMAANDYGSRFFRNDAQPRGVLKVPGQLKDDEAADEYRRRWYSRYGGRNQGGIAVLSQGLEFQQIGMSNEDAQFLETRQYNARDIARIYRIPGHMINEMTGSIKANVEQMGLEFVTYTLMSWLTRWELRLNQALLTPREQEEYFFEFLVDGLMRADIRSRYTAYRQATGGAAWMEPNEVRRLENMAPHDDGEGLYQPKNMSLGPGPDADDDGGGGGGGSGEEDDDERREAQAAALAAAELQDVAGAADRMNPGRFLNWARVHYDRVAARVALELDVPLAQAQLYAERSYAELLSAGSDRSQLQSLLETWGDGAKASQLRDLM